ncbi:hypothetical protein ACFL96_20155 [Thermoproteota archaeon]
MEQKPEENYRKIGEGIGELFSSKEGSALEEQLYSSGGSISKLIGDRDYVSALSATENALPEDMNKDAFYAGIALALAGELDGIYGEREPIPAKSQTGQLLQGLIDYCKSRCDYFSE